MGLTGVAVVGGLLLSGGHPTSKPPPEAALAAVTPDLPPLAHDGDISEGDLQHDSRDDLYRTPLGAVPAGTRVTLRLRAAAGDLTAADVRISDTLHDIEALAPMHVAATDATAGKHGYDYWEASVDSQAIPTVLEYQFVVHDGPAVRYLSDDSAEDGGTGNIYSDPPDIGWQITAYDPAFVTPDWTRGAVAYQIFPDRFFNGDPANDPSPEAQPGASGAARYRSGDVYGNPVLQKTWTDRPEGYCRAYQGVTCAEAPLGRDFFGGDLAGITAKLDTLKDLGVTVLYLNPVFAAPSNHRYDTTDYMTIDPDLGTQADFDALMAAAKGRGIHVLLDGVFNHVSSDSPWFDRAHHFSEVGACESADSPYRTWFTFRAPSGNEPSPCAPSTKGGSDTYYVGWAGFDTIPELQEVPAVQALLTGAQGVVRHWIDQGTAGWRLDVMDNLSDGLLKQIRLAAKAADPNALVLGEQWSDSSRWLLGDEADSVMNYRFRRAAIALVNGATPDLDGSLDALTPSQFVAAMRGVQEDYPKPAFDALLNLVDSHDTTRILWTLTPGAENDAAKSDPTALAEGKAKLREIATIQLTWPGMASIYYGDEVGLTGQDDPDDRRPYPWGQEDAALQAFYRTLAHLRADHVALREGDLRFLLADDDSNTLAFARRTDQEATLTAVNLATTDRTVSIDVSDVIPDGTAMTDGLGGRGATVSAGKITLALPGRGSAVLITPAGADLAPPAAPTGLVASATSRSVSLSWTPVDGAAGYRVWRSVVSGGGYVPVGDVAGPSFADTTVRDAVAYHYVVTALDDAGNVSGRSAEAVATPRLTVDDAVLEAPATLEAALSATAGTPVTAHVTVRGVTSAPGPAVGIRLQAGFGPVGSDPASEGWAWTDMSFDDDVGLSDRFTGMLRPEEAGDYEVVARLSTDGGMTWVPIDRDGSANGYQSGQAAALAVGQGPDQNPPPAPAAPTVVDVSGSVVTLTWPAVDVPDLYRYEIWRDDSSGGPYTRLGRATSPSFNDDTVQDSAHYVYVITAQDTSYNRSAYSPETAVAAEQREVDLTFTVTVPKGAPAADVVFIAGDFQGWNPGSMPMTRIDATHWAITIKVVDGQSLQYKYTRGTWDAVEKDSGCGEIPNRTLTVSYGDGGSEAVADVVAKWRDLGHCG
ncbi:MAG: alpha-amylase family glycosyl hydrolase [Candidatus Limnocylindrales bacterium]